MYLFFSTKVHNVNTSSKEAFYWLNNWCSITSFNKY